MISGHTGSFCEWGQNLPTHSSVIQDTKHCSTVRYLWRQGGEKRTQEKPTHMSCSGSGCKGHNNLALALIMLAVKEFNSAEYCHSELIANCHNELITFLLSLISSLQQKPNVDGLQKGINTITPKFSIFACSEILVKLSTLS